MARCTPSYSRQLSPQSSHCLHSTSPHRCRLRFRAYPGPGATYVVTITLVSGSTRAVSLDLRGLPSDATFYFRPNVGNPTFTSTLLITTTTRTPLGDHVLTIVASGGGVVKSTTVTLRVVQPPIRAGSKDCGALAPVARVPGVAHTVSGKTLQKNQEYTRAYHRQSPCVTPSPDILKPTHKTPQNYSNPPQIAKNPRRTCFLRKHKYAVSFFELSSGPTVRLIILHDYAKLLQLKKRLVNARA